VRAAGAKPAYNLLMFSPAVIDHFQNPRNAGELPGATATADVVNPVCGDVLRLAVRIQNGAVIEARFKAQGCVTSVACASLLTEMIRGKKIEEARRITPAAISDALGGLPPATLHGAQLACDALEAVLVGQR
jgi:nitrogen fixation protein NifU and related proteins